ncbi:uncharacterized protein LOC126841644 [Adelges cooleyi]|uniref:uncharacterized protein LOC126841644 n=1 Tax=Adelges cooleyi TaxID=133065 RepID=UPI00217FB0F8|nr:uncharacterized protein LOC126841644 [Adelges cooleyi]
MHFKSAVILCAVNFISSVWSIGLNKDQIEICIRVNDNSNPGTFTRNITDEGYYNLAIKKAFLELAYTDKKELDSFGVPMLTTIEVEFYLNKFNEHLQLNGQNRYLTEGQLSVLFNQLHLTEGEKAMVEHLAEGKRGKVHSAAFLSIMLEILPEGNGLNEAQIEEFIMLYRFHDVKTGRIDPLKIQNVLNKFHMAIEPLEQSMLFKSDRPFAKVLMELMIVTAERFRTDNENDEIVLSTKEIRSMISAFIERDQDKDGMLSENEAKKFIMT